MINCRHLETWLLLKDSGELPFRKRLQLEQHLASCAQCRAARDELERVMSAARRSLATGEPAAQTLAAIREEAARAGLREQGSAAAWSRVRQRAWVMMRPALAIAAILLLCLGGWHWLADRHSSPVGTVASGDRDATTAGATASMQDFYDLGAMLAEDVIIVERVSDLALQQDISSLDRDLLLLEGLAI